MWRSNNLIVCQINDLIRRLALWLSCPLRPQAAQGLVEYGLILILIAIVCVGILTLTGNTISEVWYDRIINALPN